jgi:ligand-binding sensor domain-containing protein
MKLLKAPIIFSLLMAFLCRAAIGQPDLVFEHFSTGNGLSHGSVSAVLKDSKGFMWFATWDGINRYDGYSFKTFKPGEADQNPSASNRIESMTIDLLGNLWVTTYDSRAYRLERYSETFSSIPENPGPDTKVKAIFPLSSGDVWVSPFNNGAYRVVTDQTTKQFSIEHVHALGAVPLPGDEIAFLFEDQFQQRDHGPDQRPACCPVKNPASS